MKNNEGKSYEQVFNDHAELINEHSKVIRKIATRVNVLTLENEKLTARVKHLEGVAAQKQKGPFDDLLKGFGK